MLRHKVVRGLLLGLTVGPLIGCSLAGRREEGPPEKLLPVPAPAKAPADGDDAGPKLPPPVKTAADSPAAAKPGEVTAAKPESKFDPAVVPVVGPPPAKPAGPGPAAPGPTLPPPEPLSPPAAAGRPAALAPLPLPGDPHLRPAPTVYGSLLQMPPGESPIERALALTRQVDRLSAERAALALRIAALEEAIQARDKQAAAATRQVEGATAEMTQARAELTRWADDLRDQQARLRLQEKENHDLLRSVIATLERVATSGTAAEPEKSPSEPDPSPGPG